MSPPRLTEYVVGYRRWLPYRSELVSVTAVEHVWVQGTNEAKCLYTYSNHGAPDANCECGLYAYHAWRPLETPRADRPYPSTSYVLGAIIAWGRIQVHASGFRAQYAKIIALATSAAVAPPFRLEMERHYGVPFVRREDVPAIAAEYGSTVPEELRPPLRRRDARR